MPLALVTTRTFYVTTEIARHDPDARQRFFVGAKAMKTHVLSYFVTLVVMAALDFVWLGRMGDALYRPVMGDMALPGFRIGPAIAFYLLFVGGVVYFAVAPALAGGGAREAALNGAVFGFCAYATYDLTNQATLKNWSTMLSAIDMGWGTILTAVSATTAYFVVGAVAARI
jgi:uncharacterized membrane protein